MNNSNENEKYEFSNQTLNDLIEVDLSITISPDELKRFTNKTSTIDFRKSPFQNQNQTIGCGNFDSLPLSEKSHQIHCQFFEILQTRTNNSEVFNMVQDFILTCTDTIDELSKHRRGANDPLRQNEFLWLTQERNTWRLLYCLYKDRIIVQKETIDYDYLPLIGSEKIIVEHLYTTNSNLREYQLVVDWLELCALEQSNQQYSHYTDRTVCWENTLHQLQNQQQLAFGSQKDIVKCLDPDAPYREKKPLHDLDVEDEMRLSKQILHHLRQGRIEEAQTLCEHCGQPWRAAMFEGWRLFHDPNFESIDSSVMEVIEGNPRRDLWKKIAWQMADRKTLDMYTRANIGVLCGHLQSMLEPLSKSWTDLLWAYLKVQIDIRVESEIRSSCTKSYVEMPDQYWENKMSLEQIFNELNAHKNISIRSLAESPICIIQKYIILDYVPDLMRAIDGWVTNDGNESPVLDIQILRFLTHFMLFLRQIGKQHQKDIADRIIEKYVEKLIELREIQIVAFYTAAVSNRLRIPLYSKLLQKLDETLDRKLALEEALRAGLDVYSITCHTVETVRNETTSDDSRTAQPLQGTFSNMDLRKMSVLEWLTFYPQQRGELLWQANAMIRTFLAENKLECVRRIFKIIPADSINHIIVHYGSKDNLPRKEDCSIKEYLCYQTYISAIDGYTDWTEFYHKKPQKPQASNTKNNFTEQVAADHKKQTFQMELQRWQIVLMEQTNVTKHLLYNVLLFPDHGFLIDPYCEQNIADDEVNVWENRTVQLENLRKLCIPEVVTLLHTILHLSGNYNECVKLADKLALEERRLYAVFSKQKLMEIIGKLAESSMALMKNKFDPWGYASAT